LIGKPLTMKKIPSPFLYFLILFNQFTTPSSSQEAIMTSYSHPILYRWRDNTLKVFVEGYKCKDIIVTAAHGNITRNYEACSFTYSLKDSLVNYDTLRTGVKVKGKIKWISDKVESIRPLPDPEPIIGGNYSMGSIIPKSAFVVQAGIILPVPDPNSWHIIQDSRKQVITNFSAKIARNDSTVFIMSGINGYLFPDQFTEFVRFNSLPGDTISFYDLKTLLYESEVRLLNKTYSIILK